MVRSFHEFICAVANPTTITKYKSCIINRMDESATKRRIGSVVTRMRTVIRGEIDDKALGELEGLANELDQLEDELSDGQLKNAIKYALNLIAGGVIGYIIGRLAEQLDKIEVML